MTIQTIQFHNVTNYNTTLPKRATWGSAGYDFVAPHNIVISPGETVLVKTGVKCMLSPDVVLFIVPRSSLGIKQGLALANTIAVIDSDYYNNPNNEGHIMLALKNNGNRFITINEGERFCQGIAVPFVYDKNEAEEDFEKRTGGIGSTGV